MTASYPGYNDSTLRNLVIEEDDTLEVVFHLLHPEVVIDPQEIEAELPVGGSVDFDIHIANPGNGRLEWEVKPRPRGEADIELWTMRQSIDIGDITGDSRIEGVVFTGDHYYVTGANRIGREDGPDLIYILNRDGELVDSLLQPEGIGSNYGIFDLAWDGELIWGTGSDSIGGFTTDGELRTSLEGPYNPNHAIAWDPDRELLWVSAITQGISGVDREGNVVTTLDRKGFRIYGLAYWEEDPDGYNLYIFHNPGDNQNQYVHKMNTENGDTMFVANLGSQVAGTAGGAYITQQLDHISWVFMDVANDGEHDRIDVWQLGGITGWMDVEPAEGTIETAQDQNIRLTLDATDLPERVYEGQLLFQHNAVGGETSLPVTLTVTLDAANNEDANLPDQFGITGVYPNPFNSVTQINYSLQNPEYIELMVYDLTGRQMDVIDQGYKTGGYYTASYDASLLPSGVYILSLTTTEQSSVRKMLLIK